VDSRVHAVVPSYTAVLANIVAVRVMGFGPYIDMRRMDAWTQESTLRNRATPPERYCTRCRRTPKMSARFQGPLLPPAPLKLALLSR